MNYDLLRNKSVPINQETALQISVDLCKTVNFAMQQNYVPVVRKITIENLSGTDYQNLLLSVETDPDIAGKWNFRIDLIPAGTSYPLEGIDLRLSASRLFEFTERINGTLTATIAGEFSIIAYKKYDIAFLSYDEWSGSNTNPEFLAAFVTPNHPYISELFKRSEPLLEHWRGSYSFIGYQSKSPKDVKLQMAAIYASLQRENISYSMPPASFESNGQKIRLCDIIREQKLGTCLDLTLLYASCLEAAGLNAMVVIVKGHAFIGCWLEEKFSQNTPEY